MPCCGRAVLNDVAPGRSVPMLLKPNRGVPPYDHLYHTGPMPPSIDPATLLPLKPVELEILLALAVQERHGYGLVQYIAERTGDVVRLEPGNLYRVIKRLLDDNLVQESSRRSTPAAGNERRRYYRLSALGARVANAELRRLRAVLASGAARVIARRAGAT